MNATIDALLESVTVKSPNAALFGHRLLSVWIAFLILLYAAGGVQADPPVSSGERPVGEARTPNLLGITGLLQMPTAYLERDRHVSFFLRCGDGTSGGAILGVANRVEIGVRGEKTGGRGGTFLTSAKVNLLPEQLILPAVSAGVVDAFGGDSPGVGGYVVASKYLIPYFLEALIGRSLALKVHVGYGGGVLRREPFAGAELFLTENLSGMAEVVGGQANLGVRYYQRGFAATVGLLGADRAVGSISFGMPLR
jgi:hypothetical protein